MIENQAQTMKFYSQKAIAIATYFGGPLAAGILARQNFINLGQEKFGKYSLIIGVVSTVLIFIGIFSIPENIIDKVPNAIIPLIYTGIIYLIIEKTQGKELKEHKTNSGEFYSAWKATGVGAICLLILSCGILGYAYLSPGDFDAKEYDNGLAKIYKNDEKALELFKMIETSSPLKCVQFIDNVGIPAYKNNIDMLEDLDKIEGLYETFLKQNQILKDYCKLRIESYTLIKSKLSENTDIYDEKIQLLNQKIDSEITELGKLK